MAGKLPPLVRSSPSKTSLPRVASQLEDFPNLELLKAVSLEHPAEGSGRDAMQDTPIARIPAGLGHSQTLPRHHKELQKLQQFHLVAQQSPQPTPSRVSNIHSHISNLTHRSDSKPVLLPASKLKKKGISAYQARMPSLSAKKSYRPSTSIRSSSVAAKRPSFLSYLLEKSISFTASKHEAGLNPHAKNTEYRSSSVRYTGKTSLSSTGKSADIVSYIGDYHGGDREGDGEACYRSGDSYKGSWARGKRYGYGEYAYKGLGLVYKGDWAEDLKQGRGVVVYENGDTMDSQWAEDVTQECKGKIEYVSLGAEYNGDLKDANKHGEGQMNYPGGSEYRGAFQNDRRHGYGLLTFLDGSLFEGFFEHDYASGPGVLQLKNALSVKMDLGTTKSSGRGRGVVWSRDEKEEKFGNLDDFYVFATTTAVSSTDIIWKTLSLKEFESRFAAVPSAEPGRFHSGLLSGVGIVLYGEYGLYLGEFREGKRSGVGRMTYMNEGQDCCNISDTLGEYEGQWRKDMRHGTGRMKWKNGLVYEGQYREDRRHNVQGTMTFPTGEKYTGMWVNDLMNGLGKYEEISGVVFTGKFVNGFPYREGAIDTPDGHYEGDLREMKPNGHGRFAYSNGDVYVGELVDGVRTGTGKMFYKDGSEYAGEWKEGMREGWGSYKSPSESYEGSWARDHKHGNGLLRGPSGTIIFEGLWRDGVKEGHGTHCG